MIGGTRERLTTLSPGGKPMMPSSLAFGAMAVTACRLTLGKQMTHSPRLPTSSPRTVRIVWHSTRQRAVLSWSVNVVVKSKSFAAGINTPLPGRKPAPDEAGGKEGAQIGGLMVLHT